ncbi:MAG: hypothetical protein HY270_08300 [Deltaproteobacteria bacterium]|nr:hypothetical protein [Deltaproteobacteria bacterium]
MADFELWIEAEEWEEGEWNPSDSLTDVVVTLPDGTHWIAGFCSFGHLETLRRSCSDSGECLSGKYLWASDLILIDDTSRTSVAAVVEDLLSKGDLQDAFSEVVEDDDGNGHDHDDEDPHEH